MPLVTQLTSVLGIQHPVICGGMHYVGYASLAAAVSNAGGLGMVTALTQPTPERLRQEIKKTRQLTSKPFGVNLTLLPALVPPDYDAYVDVVLDEKVKIVETAGRNPDMYIRKLKAAGVIVIHKCVSIRHALTAERLGVDFVSVDGFECAGHPGEEDVPNFVLLAQATRKLKVPFLASGGVGTGRQLAAALALGAEGVSMGTRFMATVEAPIHPRIKEAIVEANETSTTLVMRSLRNTERVYKNKVALEVQHIEKERPGDIGAIRHLVKGENYRKSFQETGDTESSVWSAGMVMGLIDQVLPCKDLIEGMVKEAEDIIKNRLNALVVPSSKL
jgi:nitronate monooxygenase